MRKEDITNAYRKSMFVFRGLVLLPICMLALALTSELAWGQMTTGSLRGLVIDDQGNPIGNAQVVLLHGPSQTTKTTEVNDEGQFVFNSLRVGGPYRIEVKASQSQPFVRESIFVSAGNNETIYAQLVQAEVIAVTGSRTVGTNTGRNFSEGDIRNNASVGQDIKDIVKLSPDAYLDGSSLSIGGANNRFNSITIDGVRQDDDFGLNSNGYPTQRSPIALQAIEEISVERSPFDVRYRNFLGGNINVVTKSGTNEYKGSVMVTRSGEGLTGTKIKDRSFSGDATEQRLSLSLGGPVVKDRLHFFLNAEGMQVSRPNRYGLSGSGKSVEITEISASEIARAQEVSQRVYGFDAGKVGQDTDLDDLKLLGKLDWTINDKNRFEAKYQQVSGNQTNDGRTSEDRAVLTSNWYSKRDSLKALSLRLFSDIDSSLSTKFEYSYKQVKTEQTPLNGRDFASVEIQLERESSDNASILLGPDTYRQANELSTSSHFVSGEASYLTGNHQVIGGAEYEQLAINNLFLPQANGAATYDSLEDFEAQNPSELVYRSTASLDAKDAAADWGYGVSSFYLQDEWNVNPSLRARFGVRSEFYHSDSKITENRQFEERHGFKNTSSLDGRSILAMPRLGLDYQWSQRLSLRLGGGLYSGGTPNVWISNSYTNNGVSTARAVTSENIAGFDGRNIPESLQNQVKDLVANADGDVDALDPDFKIPQSWKASLGGSYRFDVPYLGNNFLLDFDYTYSKVRYGLQWKDLRRNHPDFVGNQPTAKAPDGRDIYDTNPTESADGEFNPNRGYDMLLTNTSKGYSQTAYLSLSKYFDSGFDVSGSYAWQDVWEISPATSSQSSSNYGNSAVGKDPNNPDLARSDYERKHRILMRAGYNNQFWKGLTSSFALFWERRSGRPFSYTFTAEKSNHLASMFGEEATFARRNRMLFYVPKGDGSDVILKDIDPNAFNAYLKKTGLDRYRGKIAPRNAFFADWLSQINLRLSQELPGLTDTSRTRLVFDIENLPNLLNSNWGQNRSMRFPYFVSPVDVSYDSEQGKYVYSNFKDKDPQSASFNESIWRMQIAMYYEF